MFLLEASNLYVNILPISSGFLRLPRHAVFGFMFRSKAICKYMLIECIRGSISPLHISILCSRFAPKKISHLEYKLQLMEFN